MGSQADRRVRDLVAAHLPDVRIDSVVSLGEGMDNVAYEVDGELVVRLRKQADGTDCMGVRREAELLAVVADVSPVPVPSVVFVDPAAGCLAYRKLPGVPMAELPPSWRATHGESVAAVLGDFLRVLHAVPADRVAGLVDVDDEPTTRWLADARASLAAVPAEHRDAVAAFLAAPPPADGHGSVFSHNDLGIEHVLVDPADGSVTGIIDWSDAALVDPAYDFGLLLRDLGPAALDAALRQESLWARAVFYGRCAVLEDIACGIERARDALGWLF